MGLITADFCMQNNIVCIQSNDVVKNDKRLFGGTNG